mgnify:CR=1 FL=1
MKRSDIADPRVINLAAAWQADPQNNPGVIVALTNLGVPRKVAVAKVEHLITRGLLDCGVSPNYAWPTACEHDWETLNDGVTHQPIQRICTRCGERQPA